MALCSVEGGFIKAIYGASKARWRNGQQGGWPRRSWANQRRRQARGRRGATFLFLEERRPGDAQRLQAGIVQRGQGLKASLQAGAQGEGVEGGQSDSASLCAGWRKGLVRLRLSCDCTAVVFGAGASRPEAA